MALQKFYTIIIKLKPVLLARFIGANKTARTDLLLMALKFIKNRLPNLYKNNIPYHFFKI